MAIKKTSAKKTVKKAASVKKPAINRKESLKKVGPEVSFYLCNGACCSDLFQLADEIDRLTDEMFAHHVNSEKDDFANWVEHVFNEPGLAKLLKKARNKDRHVVEIQRYIIKRLK